MTIPGSFVGMPSLLVGREREQVVLRDHLAAMLAGRGGLVLIGGEAGIGKTALAEATCREAAERGALVLVGRCYDLTETPPYGPWAELFARYRAADGNPPGSMPPLPSAFAERGTIGQVASAAALFQQVGDFLATAATARPLVLLFDDLHWADSASLDLLRFIARHAAASALLLIVTYRADELPRRHPLSALLPLLDREARAARLDLRRLTADAVRALVARYRLPDADRERLVTHLQARAEGNAFFITQLLRALEEDGTLRSADDRWALGDLGGVPVPMPLRQVIDGRLARLGEETQRLLAVAAVIGQDVPLDVWASVAGTGEQTLSEAIEEAIAAHLIDERPDGTHARFVHALIRETLYECILPSRRRRIHRQVGEALATLPNPDPDAVAYHFRQAGDARAMIWLYRAGTRAAWAFTLTMALDRIEAALALLPMHTTEDGPFPSADENRALAAHLLFSRGVVRCQEGALRQGLADMETAIATLDSLAIADDAPLAKFLRAWAISPDRRNEVIQWLAPTGHYDKARALAEHLVAREHTRAQRGEEESGTLAHSNAYYALGLVHSACGRPDAARRAYVAGRAAAHAARAMSRVAILTLQELIWVTLPYDTQNLAEQDRLTRAAEEAFARAHDRPPGILPRFAHLPVLFLRGQWQEVRTLARAMLALNLGGSYRHIPARSLARLVAARGNGAWIERLTREELPDGPDTAPGNTIFPTALTLQRLSAALAIGSGDQGKAREWLEAHDRWVAWNGTMLGRSEGQALWAAYHRATGDAAAAYESAIRALRHATEPRQPLALLAAHRLLGELDTDAGKDKDAETHLTQSLALADACAAPYERALTLLALAELRAATGNRAEALTLLDEARAICTPLGAKPALARAETLMARLAAAEEARPVYPAGLSPREVEVLRLVAAGRTNRDIADALFLSEHTVRVHVRNILTKTDTANRTEAAAFALRHGLA